MPSPGSVPATGADGLRDVPALPPEGRECSMLTYIKAQPAVFEPEEIIILVGAFDKTWHTVLAGGVKLEGDAEPVRAKLAKHIIENEMLNGEVIRLDGALRMGMR